MSTVQLGALNAEILQNLGAIAADESVLTRVAKYLRKVAKEMTNDSTAMTRQEFSERIKKSKEQYMRGEYTTQLPGESVTDMLKRCGYEL